MSHFRRLLHDERGATLALTAVIMAGVMSMLALVIDLGMLRSAKGEAQNAASAAALAGAKEFMLSSGPPSPLTVQADSARDMAIAYALNNAIRGVAIDSSEVSVQVVSEERKVRVRVERQGIPLWFARLFGRTQAAVVAAAAAAANPADAARCVLPWAVPDAWYEPPPGSGGRGGDDTNRDGVWNPDENWRFGDDPGERYERFDTGSLSETGYGSPMRNGSLVTDPVNDWGRQLVLTVTRPNHAEYRPFLSPVRIGDNTGADYEQSIYECDEQVVTLGDPVQSESEDVRLPTTQAVDSLIALDPGAHWVSASGSGYVEGSNMGEAWLSSPRVRVLPLFHPGQIAQVQNGGSVSFNNFALFFVEGVRRVGNDTLVTGRLLYYAQGIDSGSDNFGTLIRVLQLVE